MALTLSHAVLQVRDLDGMIDWYTGVLGFAVTDRGPLGPGPDAPQIVFMSQDPGEHHQLALVGTSGESPTTRLHHLAFRVADLPELRGLMERIRADGRGRAPMPLSHGNTWSAYLADPEGNGIEVFCDTPWHVQQPQGRPWDTALDDDELLEATRAAFAAEPGFGPGDAYVAARARRPD